jgi:hypothetical protein
MINVGVPSLIPILKVGRFLNNEQEILNDEILIHLNCSYRKEI